MKEILGDLKILMIFELGFEWFVSFFYLFSLYIKSILKNYFLFITVIGCWLQGVPRPTKLEGSKKILFYSHGFVLSINPTGT